MDLSYSSNFAASGGREVQITGAEAQRIEQANLAALQSMKKLSLVLDLDNVSIVV
jgi:TFIIF-interacting CTD phosphatase-like protein